MRSQIATSPVTSRRAFVGAGIAAAGSIAALCASPHHAFAVTAAEKQAEAEAVLSSLNAMQEKLDIAAAEYHDAIAEQEAAQKKMTEAQERIDQANARITEIQVHLGTRARTMYRSGSLTFLDFLLGSTSFADFTNNWSLLERINQTDAEMIQETKDLKAEIEAQKAEYAKQEKLAAEKAETARKAKEEAEATVAAMQATYDSLSAEAAELLEQERAAQAEADRLAAESVLDNIIQSGKDEVYEEPPYNAVTGNSVVDRAYSYLGNASYVWGACSPGKFDCSGFVSYCLSGSYSRLGSTTTFMNWPRTNDPQPGDVCTNATHCGIYIGGGQMIHCSTYGVGVIQSAVYNNMIFVRY